MQHYITTPKTITYKDAIENNYSLSPNSYKTLHIKNKNYKTINELALNYTSGKEIGSLACVRESNFIFLRTRAISSYLYNFDISLDSKDNCIKPDDFYSSHKENMILNKGDILFVTGGNVGEVAIVEKRQENIIFSSHIIKLQFENPYYIFAFLKHRFCKEQVNIAPIGAIKGLDTFKIDYLLNCKIPFPKDKNIIDLVETIMQSIIYKEYLIKQRHKAILDSINKELESNQLDSIFTYKLPTYKDIIESTRLDCGIYEREFKEIDFKIRNYKGGFSSFKDLGFTSNRGQNLQEFCIGKSIYSEVKINKNFYSLALPTHFSNYGTIDKIIYLGNKNLLRTLKKGEVVFGAEGSFRSIVVIENEENFITNIHGITLYKNDLIESIFVKLFMDFLVSKNFIDAIIVGGHGGSLAQKYWDIIPFPNFPKTIQEKIAKLYHNENATLDYSDIDLLLQNNSSLRGSETTEAIHNNNLPLRMNEANVAIHTPHRHCEALRAEAIHTNESQNAKNGLPRQSYALSRNDVLDCHENSCEFSYNDVLDCREFANTNSCNDNTKSHDLNSCNDKNIESKNANSYNYNIESFKTKDRIFCENAGIYDLDKSIKTLKAKLDSIVENIINES